MKLIKSDSVINLMVIIAIFLLFSPAIIEVRASKEVKFLFYAIIVGLFFISVLYQTYKDITKKQFTTTFYIVLVDIIKIITFAALGYLALKNYNETDFKILAKESSYSTKLELIFICAITVESLIKGDRFKKKI